MHRPALTELCLKRMIRAFPWGRKTLFIEPVEAIRQELSIRRVIRAELEKRIPVARGLGGGSSDAAAALIGMLRLTKKKLPLERLMCIAAGLGADVPFFFSGDARWR